MTEKMRRERERQRKQDDADRRAASRRPESEYFPATGPEVERENARMLARVKTRVAESLEHERQRFILNDEHWCDWCSAEETARILVSPAEYSSDGTRLLKPSRTAWACFDCTRRLGLLLVDTRQFVKEREQASRIARAEQRAKDKAAQTMMFDDERLNTNPLTNG